MDSKLNFIVFDSEITYDRKIGSGLLPIDDLLSVPIDLRKIKLFDDKNE